MALTQIHGSRQILDGTIKNAEIAADAAVANSKLDLASVVQAVTLAHAAGLRVENAQGAAMVQRNTNVAVESGGLYRLIIDGNGVLRVQRNTTPAGNFGATADPLQIRDVAVRLFDASLELRESAQVLPAGLWRLAGDGNALKVQQNTANAGDFSTVKTPLQFGTGGDGVVINDTIAIIGRSLLNMNGSEPRIQLAQNASPTEQNIVFRGTDDRLHWKTAAADNPLAYLSDIVSPGNTVLVSEYVTKETPAGVVDGVNTTFTLAFTPEPGTEQVYLNGLLQSPGATEDYTISGATITFSSAPVAGDKIRVSYIKA